MRFFACVVGAICKSPYAVACVFSSNSPALQIHPCFQLPPPCGRANYNSPLRVCYLDVRKYRCKYTCKYTEKHHGHGVSMFAHVVGAICKSPLCCCVRFFLESLTLQIRPCYKFTHVFNCPPCGRANCN